jgi:large subunit ribosomal protein L25
MSEMTIQVEKRDEIGKNANRRLRAAGQLPAVVYGDQKEPVAITINRRTVIELLKKGGGENAVFLLELAGSDSSRHAMIRDLQVDPISRQIVHIDFQRIRLSQKVRVQVAVQLEGEAHGVKNEGGVLDFITRELEVECLPTAIPQGLVVDVTRLAIGDHVEAKDIELPEGVELMEEGERVIVSISHSRVAAEIDELEAEGEGEELLIEAGAEEPEVIGKGKEAEEEDAE